MASAIVLLIAQAVVMGSESARALLPFSDRGEGNFYSVCKFSHRLPDDPIVAPGRAGASHLHDFFGNTSTNAHSTYDSLSASMGSCHRPNDRAAYWVPTLSQNGQALTPVQSVSFYATAGKAARTVKPFPAGIRIIAGDSKATTANRAVLWSCEGSAGRSTGVPMCSEGMRLRLHIRFPDCWNGRDLDSPDHKSHLTYFVYSMCPSAYPVPLPYLELVTTYPTQGGSGVAFSSGSPYTAHADFLNSWVQRRFEELVKNCLNAGRACGGHG